MTTQHEYATKLTTYNHDFNISPFLSIVIPAYNAQTTIKRCIKSIYAALLNIDFEIIVVDNASTDNTCRQIEKFSLNNNNIELIRLEKNYGPGHARNIGFTKTSGKFVWFIDADDEIPFLPFKDLDIQKTCENRDIVMFKYNRAVSGCFGTKQWLAYDAAVMNSRPGDDFTAEEFPSVLTASSVVWNKWFSRESILTAGMEFPQTLTGEDLAFVTANLCAAKNIGFIDRILYTYHEDASQISCVKDERRLEVFKAFEICEQWLKERNIGQECLTSYNLCKAYNLLYTYKTVHESLREKVKVSLDEHLLSLDGEMFMHLLQHPFLKKDLKTRMLKLRGINSKIMDKMLPINFKILNNCFRPFAYAVCGLFLFALSLFSFSASDAFAADNLYILAGGGGGGFESSSDGGCSGGGGGYSDWSLENGIYISLNGGSSNWNGAGAGGGGGGYIGDGLESIEYNGSGNPGYDKEYPGKGGLGYGGGENGEDGTETTGGKGGSAHYFAGDINRNKIIMIAGENGINGGTGGSVNFTGGNVNVKKLSILNKGIENGAVFSADTLAAEFISLNLLAEDGNITTNSYDFDNWGYGNININVATLNIINNDTVIRSDGESGYSIFFNTINMGSGKTFDVYGYIMSDFDAFNTFNVLGKNATFSGNLQAAGKNLNFYINSDVAHNDTMLFVNGSADISDSKIGINIAGENIVLEQGNQITLINAEAGIKGTPATNEVKGFHGVSLVYDFDYNINDTEMIATVKSTSLNPQTEALSEGMAAQMTLLDAGSDLVSDFGISEAAAAAKGESFFSVFSAASAGKSRFHTGSHIDVSGFSMMGGLATGLVFSEEKKLAFGAFAEYGAGDYNSYNNFHGFANVEGSGDSSYTGVGFLSHFDRDDFYVGIAGRVGEIKNEFKSNDLGIIGANTSYSTDCLYYGMNVGGGYVLKIAEKFKMDTYGKYSFIYQNSVEADLSSGDKVKFDASSSQRIRVGTKTSYIVSRFFAPYAAANFEYEFGGDIDAKIQGFSIDSPSLKGGTGVGEIGITGKAGSFSADLGVRGYCGKREGFDSMLKLIYHIGS